MNTAAQHSELTTSTMPNCAMDLSNGTTMNLNMTVKQLGRKKALTTRDYNLRNFPGQPTLQELLTRIVTLEVNAFRERQIDNQFLRVLTETQLLEASETGKISLGGQEFTQEVNTDQAIQTAIQAFQDGLYYVFNGENQIEYLSDVVNLEVRQDIMFLRLVALVGG
jgi:hypothetical protein